MTGNELCVYEALNPATREAVFGVTDTNRIEALRALHKLAPPAWLARWGAEQPIAYTIVEGFESLEAAKAFAASRGRAAGLTRLVANP